MTTRGHLSWGAALCGAVLLSGPLLAGCAGPDRPESGEAASGSPSPRSTPPAELCARIVAHWSREVLGSGTYGDYQSMGLSDGQYEILRDVVDAARAERERHGTAAARTLIGRQAERRCADRHRTGDPTGGPWS
ncbi:hypothetical protein [Streptomyces sp. NPDC093094]|uniref:hypothetical protein n=1 Tax=Streptomyces sp. NPDC093094 TaxID=3366026 RepID=UPI0037F305B7